MATSPTRRAAVDLAAAILDAAESARTENDLLIRVEAALQPILEELGIPSAPSYEKTLIRGRADAVYGFLTIEYEMPGILSSAGGARHAFGQCKHYMREQAEIASPGEPQAALPNYVGVALDGQQIGFVHWRLSDEEAVHPDLRFKPLAHGEQMTIELEADLAGQFVIYGPQPVSVDSITDLLVYLRALSRRMLDAKSLADDFGPTGDVAKSVVRALHAALLGASSPRTRVLLGEWRRMFGAVYGEVSGRTSGTRAIAATYGIEDADLGRMLFAVHTYFALIMKVLAVELVALQYGATSDPLVGGLSALPDPDLHARFEQLESGALFRASGIENFIESDFLGWYVDEWSEPLSIAIRDLSRRLSEYEPATATLRPDMTQDLVKRLYHRLLPRELRHDLGEYYTPDWLAEWVMDGSGYDGAPGTKMLDPACGSGTFMVLAIRKMKEVAGPDTSPADLARSIVEGVVGFDLNPLAVIAARTNYLLACGDLIRAIAPFHIPVYLCDSITAPSLTSTGADLLGVPLQTSVGTLTVPSGVATAERLSPFVADLEFCVHNGFHPAEFIDRVEGRWDDLDSPSLETARRLYEALCDIHARGEDGIWPRVLQNAFAPLFHRGRFDFVIGNPPWIAWESMSVEYRAATRSLWERYGLFTLGGTPRRRQEGRVHVDDSRGCRRVPKRPRQTILSDHTNSLTDGWCGRWIPPFQNPLTPTAGRSRGRSCLLQSVRRRIELDRDSPPESRCRNNLSRAVHVLETQPRDAHHGSIFVAICARGD